MFVVYAFRNVGLYPTRRNESKCKFGLFVFFTRRWKLREMVITAEALFWNLIWSTSLGCFLIWAFTCGVCARVLNSLVWITRHYSLVISEDVRMRLDENKLHTIDRQKDCIRIDLYTEFLGRNCLGHNTLFFVSCFASNGLMCEFIEQKERQVV